jgi:hypothetical protein
MCKDDHDRRFVMLDSQLGDLASEDKGKKYSPAEIKVIAKILSQSPLHRHSIGLRASNGISGKVSLHLPW